MKNQFSAYVLCLATSALVAGGALAQNQPVFVKDAGGWKIYKYQSSETTPTPSCSAVQFLDHVTAMRVERFNEGYMFGVNGLDRASQGKSAWMAFWFDGDRSGELSGDAGFVKDVAYPHDDWLSFFQPIDAKLSPVEAIASRKSLSFAFKVPGNRSGGDEVKITFPLKGSGNALQALEDCYQSTLATSSAALNQGSADQGSCPDDGPRLKLSGICTRSARHMLEMKSSTPPMLMQNCGWEPNETSLPGGDFLFYSASSCGGHLSQLEFSGGAKTASLTLSRSAMGDGQPGGDFATVIHVDPANPKASVLAFVRNAMGDPAAAAKCSIHPAGGDEQPKDAFVVLDPTSTASTDDGPGEGSCGPFGTPGDSTSYWRVLEDMAFYISLGQDAYQDIDPASLTLIRGYDIGG